MSYLYLLMLVFFSGIITVIAKLYNGKNSVLEGSSGIYNILYPLGATITYGVFYFSDFAFEPGALLYSVLYGAFYTLFTVGLMGSIKFGVSSITALVKQTALVGVSVWGFIFFGAPVTVNAVIGVILIIVALCLCLVEKSKPKSENNRKRDFRLSIYLLLIAIGNVGCPLTHKYLLIRYDGKHGYMMLFFALFISTLILIACSLKDEKKNWKKIALSSGYLPVFSGFCGAMTGTMQTILLNRDMSTSIIYPTLAVGGLTVTLVFSVFAFKERLRPIQWCGIAVGCVALVMLNV